MDERGSIPGRCNDWNFSLRRQVQTGSAAYPASYQMGIGVLTQGIKRPEREADHSPPSSAEVRNVWSCTSIPQYFFMAWCLIKQEMSSSLLT
jgi:hypothetical protein